MKRTGFFFVLVLLSILNSQLFSQWTQINNGLTSLVINALTSSNTYVFAGTNGQGVFRTSNSGGNWEQVNTGLTNQFISALAYKYPTLFVGTNGGGIYKSTNNGSNWTQINIGLNHLQILDIFIDSNGDLFVGTVGGGVYYSTDNGLNWTQRNNGLSQNYNVFTITRQGSTLFCAGTGIFKSTNNGLNWTQINQLNNIWIHDLITLGQFLFAATESNYIYRSSDGGGSWTQLTTGLNNSIIQTLFTVGNNIFCGSNGGVFLSTNNGGNWSTTNLSSIVKQFTTFGGDIYAGTFGQGIYKRSLNQMLQQTLSVSITSDNAYVFGFGDVNGITTYYAPGVCNILAQEIYSPNTGVENYTIYESLVGKYVYIIAWSDELTFQGTIAQFSDGNLTVLTSPTIPNGYVQWEVFATGINLNPSSNDPEPTPPNYIPRANSNCPSLNEVNTQIAIANSNLGNPATTSVGWVTTTPTQGKIGVLAFGPDNHAVGSPFPPQIVSGINSNAHWMWYNPDPNNILNPFITDNFPNFPSNKSREYYIFRIGPLDSIFTSCNCIEPPSNMVAWWPLDETSGNIAHDLVGFPNNGSCNTCPTPVSGKVDGALEFLNNNQYIFVNNHQELDFGRSDFSIDAWVKTGNCKKGIISPIVEKLDVNQNPPRGYSFYLTQNPEGSLYLNIKINGTTYTSSTPVQINPNSWYHVAVTVKRGSTPLIGTFYVNGQQVGTFTPNLDGPVTNNEDLWIGKSKISDIKCPIIIDELELFNRSLDSNEVKNIWLSDTCGKCKPTINCDSCENNIIKNWDYELGAVAGPMPSTGKSSGWAVAYGTPDIKIPGGCCDSVYVGLWGNQKNGEAIQTNCYFSQGNSYSIRFCARWVPEPNRPYPPQFVFRASNVQLTSPLDLNGVLIGVSAPLNQTNQWVTMTLPNWVAPNNFSLLTISVTNQSSYNHQDSVTYAHIDRICVQKNSSTDIHETENIPSDFELLQCYPNPFNPFTTIEYHVPYLIKVNITVYDLLGSEVKVVVNELKQAGKYKIIFDGSKLPSGVYFYRMKAGNFQETKKLILMK